MNLGITLEEQARCAYFFFDYIVQNLMCPGHVENWFILMDFKDVGVTELPVNQLKNFVAAMNRNFRGRMFRMIVANTPTVLRGAWSIIYSWLDKFI